MMGWLVGERYETWRVHQATGVYSFSPDRDSSRSRYPCFEPVWLQTEQTRGTATGETMPASPELVVSRQGSHHEEELDPACDAESPVSVRIRLSFGMIGISALMPWNAFITAMPYFLARVAGSPFTNSFASWLSVIWTSTAFTSLGFATWTAGNYISTIRVILPLILNTLLITFLATTPYIPVLPTTFSILSLIDGALQASLVAYLQSSAIPLASAFGPSAVSAYMTGAALVAVGTSLLKLSITYAALEPGDGYLFIEPRSINVLKHYGGTAAQGATAYFCLSAGFVFLGICAYAYIHPRTPRGTLKPKTSGMESEANNNEPDETDYLLRRASPTPVPTSTAIIRAVARKNAGYYFAAFWDYVITLALFPAITTSITSVNSPVRSIVFNPLIFSALHFLNFNVADLIGRASSNIKSVSPTSSRSLLIYSLSRTIFVPLILLCNIQRELRFSSTQPELGELVYGDRKPFFNSDLIYALIIFFFGLTGGHISTLVLMSAPSTALNPRLEPHESKMAARVGQFCLVGGLFVGSMMSFGVRAASCGCNPFVNG